MDGDYGPIALHGKPPGRCNTGNAHPQPRTAVRPVVTAELFLAGDFSILLAAARAAGHVHGPPKMTLWAIHKVSVALIPVLHFGTVDRAKGRR